MNSILLPQKVRQEVSKLPGVTQDVVRQSLKRAPSPPICYENAVKELTVITDAPEVLRRGMLAADALALWGRMYNDNRALIQAQKIKIVSLRWMFIVAGEMGEAGKILRANKICDPRIRMAEKLASFPTQKCAEDKAEELAVKVKRIESLVTETVKESPKARKELADKWKAQRNRERQYRALVVKQKGKYNLAREVLDELGSIKRKLEDLPFTEIRELTTNERKQIKALVEKNAELLDELDQVCR